MSQSDTAAHHIAVFRVTCWQACFSARSIQAKPDQHGAIEQAEGLRRRRCKTCGDRVEVEAIWADRLGRLPAGAPLDVSGQRQAG